MKNICTALAAISTLGLALAGCGRPAHKAGQKTILASTFPMYLFTKAVVGDAPGVQVELMIPAGSGCPHDYSMNPHDRQMLSDADIIVINGLGLDQFVVGPLKQDNPQAVVIDTSKGIGQIIHIHSDQAGESGPDEHQHGDLNPHAFASPKTAGQIVKYIADQLSQADPANAQPYAANAKAYIARLDELADQFRQAVPTLRSNRIVTEHMVFDYLARDSGLEVVAVVEEVPGMEESSAGGIARLTARIKAGGAAALFVEPQYPDKVGRAVAAAAGIPVAALDPVATGPAGASLDYYLQKMRENLVTLQKTLGTK